LMMQKKLINVTPLITHRILFNDAEKGFEIAIDNHKNSMKVQIAFN